MEKEFESILFVNSPALIRVDEQPSYFVDLNLDQVVRAILKNREDYFLQGFFYTLLDNENEIEYRQKIV